MLHLEIVTPDKLFFSEEVEMVIGRGIEGDLAIMKGKSPITTPLKIGLARVFQGEEEKIASVTGGYVSVIDDKVTIVTEAAEWSDEIDVARAEEAKRRAEKRLENKPEGLDVARAEMALKKAINRLDCAGKCE